MSDYTPIQYDPKDLIGLGVREYDLEKVINAFRIPRRYFESHCKNSNELTNHRKEDR